MHTLWEALKTAKNHRWVDLTHSLDNGSPYWDGIPAGSVELCKPVIRFEDMDLEIQTFLFPGQFGTHIDYPGHFIPGGRLANGFDVKDTVLPLVVIDISGKAAENPDYELTVDDILAFEETYGKIPEGSFVALRTDWGKRWPSMERLSNVGEDGLEHFPSWGFESLVFLYEQRGIAANGHETLDTDAPVSSREHGLRAERYLLGKDKFQVEALCNLDQVPPVGSVIVIAAPRIKEANGLPVRVFAICEE